MHIQRKVGIPIEEIKEVTQFLTLALVQLKSVSVLHREINPKHILIHLSDDGRISYKLTGLQFCKDITKEKAQSFVGTPEYISPEAAQEVPYSHEADVWSMGVTLYELAVGLTTLQVDPNFRVRSKSGKPPFFPPKRTLDPALRDLICKCLIYDPKKRITAEMILDHPFLIGEKIEAPLPGPEPAPPTPEKVKPKVDSSLAKLTKKELLKIVQTNFEKYIEYVNLTENHKIKLKCERRTTLVPYILKSNVPINRGGFGAIYKCAHNSTGEEYALKVVATSKMTDVKIASLLLGEVIIMLELNMNLENICPFAIRLVDYFVYCNEYNTKNDIPYKNDLCLVLEYCNGGDLDDYIRKLRRRSKEFPSEELKLIAWNSACGINEMHKRNMMHRDIKAKNILVIEDSKGGLIDIKLCDYGLSKKVAEHQELTGSTILGTLDYFAPELYEMMEKRIAGEVTTMNYTFKVDVWSYGALLYFALYGKTIMEYPGSKYTVMNQKKIIYPEVKGTPDSYMDLIKRALVYNPDKRPSFTELLTHPFFTFVHIQKKPDLHPYTQEKLIGTGKGMKTKVYRCTKGSLTYAMKVIEGDSIDKKRLTGEIDTLTKLKNNYNIIKIYD
jgi:serine/threonine protein kinase